MDLEVSKSTVCLPKIKNVLLKYANSAANSLHGPKCSDHYSMTKHENGSSRSQNHVHHKKRDVSTIVTQDHNRSSSSSSNSSSNPGKMENYSHQTPIRPSIEAHQKVGGQLVSGGIGAPNSMNSLVNFNHYYYEAMKSLGGHPLFPFLPSVPGESNPYDGYKYNSEAFKYNSEAFKSFSSPGSRLFPILTPPDQTVNEYITTLLHDCVIPCFVIGGEKRLCMPKILVSVLKDFSLGDINAVLDELQIYCSRCTPEQLALLKKLEVIPNSTPSCGLITKTDAERLVSALFDKQQQQPRVNFSSISSLTSPSSLTEVTPSILNKDQGSTSSKSNDNNNVSAKKKSEEEGIKSGAIQIHHNCFGKCTGIFRPSMYTAPNAPCIECTTCSGLFTPSKFVCHTHKARNSRTCHWGFDSNNWRSYLVLSEHADDALSQEVLDEMKSKFHSLQVDSHFLPFKLKIPSQDEHQQDEHQQDEHHKDSMIEHHKDSIIIPPPSKRFKSCHSSLCNSLQKLLDVHAIDKAIQTKILDEVYSIIDQVKSNV